MHCEKIQKQLSFYLDGEMVREDAAAIQEHLATCQDCRQVLEKEKAFLLLLRNNLTAPPAPMHLRAQVRTMLQARHKTRKVWLWVLPPTAISAALLVLMYFCGWTTQTDWTVSTHLALMNNTQQLDVRTTNPSILKEWVSRQTDLPFHMVSTLPDEVKIQGGRAFVDKSERIVQIAYSGEREFSSLYTMPKEQLYLRGHAVTINSLTFYVQKRNGHFTVSWASAMTGYVLVSETEHGINNGCLLCHTDQKMKLPPSAFLIES